MMYCLVDCAGVHAWLWTREGWVEVSPRLFERSDGSLDLSPDRSANPERVIGTRFLLGIHDVSRI